MRLFFSVRLYDEKRTVTGIYGKPVVYIENIFYTVNAVYFTENDAQVVCRKLGGYNFSKSLARGFFPYETIRSNSSILKLNCIGSESNIYECDISYRNSSSDFEHFEDAAVMCSTSFIDDSKRCSIMLS